MSFLNFFVKNKKGNADGEVNLESIVGKKCVVIERIDTFAGCGQVRVGTNSWSARGVYDNDSFEVGESLDVVAIEGVKLICVKHQ